MTIITNLISSQLTVCGHKQRKNVKASFLLQWWVYFFPLTILAITFTIWCTYILWCVMFLLHIMYKYIYIYNIFIYIKSWWPRGKGHVFGPSPSLLFSPLAAFSPELSISQPWQNQQIDKWHRKWNGYDVESENVATFTHDCCLDTDIFFLQMFDGKTFHV